MRRPEDFNHLSDSDLDVLFGQHVGGYVCDAVAAFDLPGTCSLYGKMAHYAPDDWNRPQPIGAGGDDYDQALEAARNRFGGLSVEFVMFGNTKHKVTVWRAALRTDRESGADPSRKVYGAWDIAHERDRFVSIRRSVIRCILALADAPLSPTVKREVAP